MCNVRCSVIVSLKLYNYVLRIHVITNFKPSPPPKIGSGCVQTFYLFCFFFVIEFWLIKRAARLRKRLFLRKNNDRKIALFRPRKHEGLTTARRATDVIYHCTEDECKSVTVLIARNSVYSIS